jgi:hypothetical protein
MTTSVQLNQPSSQLQISIVAERQPNRTDLQVLYPMLSLYVLLGCSVLLRGRSQLANRLVLYLTIFLFAYGFPLNVTSLTATPIASGFSMLTLLALALIPLTVIFAFFSILSAALVPNVSDDLSIAAGMTALGASIALDLFAVGISELALWLIVKIPVNYWFGLVTYTLLNSGAGWWGCAFLLAPSLGWLVSVLISFVRVYRAKPPPDSCTRRK